MPKPIADGSFYIQKSNQDFWLRLHGVWVRMGNIRDEGNSGIVSVPPIISQGFDMSVPAIERIRYIPDINGFADAMGFDIADLIIQRTRFLGAVPTSLGFDESVSVVRNKLIVAPFNYGFAMSASIGGVALLTANMNYGFAEAVTVTNFQNTVHLSANISVGFDETTSLGGTAQLTVNYDMGFGQATALSGINLLAASPTFGYTMSSPSLVLNRLISVNMSLGYSEAVSVFKTEMLTANFSMGFAQTSAFSIFLPVSTMSVGFSEAAAVVRKNLLGTVSMAYGFSDAITVVAAGTVFLPTNTAFKTTLTPSAVNTTFTYTATGGAAESHLYDGDITTPASDPDGVSDSSSRSGSHIANPNPTHAAYDFGSAVTIVGVNAYTAPVTGFLNSDTFDVQYSDTGLTSGWVSITTLTIPAGTGQLAATSAFNVGAHRYWQIVYKSGTTTGNAWLGELQFADQFVPWAMGFSMSATLTKQKLLGSVAMSYGYSEAAALTHFLSISASMALGFNEANTVTGTAFLSASMAYGFSEAVSITHAASGTQTPTAVLTTFTYTGQTPAAAESHLYDNNDTTDAADPAGLQTTTAAAYDLGAAKTIIQVRAVNSPRFVSTGNIVYTIQYSDTSLSAGWTNSGATITMNTTLGSVSTATVSAGAHRYWRIIYSSGNINSNAWLGELQFKA